MVVGVDRERSGAPGTRAICVSTLARHRAAGVLAITDQLRPEAPSAVAAAGRLTGATPLLLTGDMKATADRLAIQVGITDVRGGLLPDDKVAAVRQLQAGGAKVAVVGDVINDAPALAAAHWLRHGRCGIGSDPADRRHGRGPRRPHRHPGSHRIVAACASRGGRQPGHRRHLMGIRVLWDMVGTLPLPRGVAGHEGSTLILGLNGLRLLRRTAWHHAVRTD
jgi:cation-transporting P-type ATPase J